MFKLTTKSKQYTLDVQMNEDLIDGKQYQLQLPLKELMSVDQAMDLLNNVGGSNLICEEELKVNKCIFPSQSKNGLHRGELVYTGGEAAIDESYIYSDIFQRFLAKTLIDSVNVLITMDYQQNEDAFQYVACELECNTPLKVVSISDDEEDNPGAAIGKEGYFALLTIELQTRSGETFIAGVCYTPESITLNEKELPSVDHFFDKAPWLQMDVRHAATISADVSGFESGLHVSLSVVADVMLRPFCKELVKDIEIQ